MDFVDNLTFEDDDQNFVMNLDISQSQFGNALKFSSIASDRIPLQAMENDSNENLHISEGEGPVGGTFEQQSTKEQARLLDRFKQLRDLQAAQQQILLRQQQEQLELLRSEENRAQKLLHRDWPEGRVSDSGISDAERSPPRNTQHSTSNDKSSNTLSMMTKTSGLPKPNLPRVAHSIEDDGNCYIDSDLDSREGQLTSEDGVFPLPDTGSETSETAHFILARTHLNQPVTSTPDEEGEPEVAPVEVDGYFDRQRNLAKKEQGQSTCLSQNKPHPPQRALFQQQSIGVKPLTQCNIDLEQRTSCKSQENKALLKERSEPRNRSSKHPQTGKTLNLDDIPVQGIGDQKKTFEELLNEQLRKEQAQAEASARGSEKNNSTRPKTFLRKGTGLARFSTGPRTISKKKMSGTSAPVHRKSAVASSNKLEPEKSTPIVTTASVVLKTNTGHSKVAEGQTHKSAIRNMPSVTKEENKSPSVVNNPVSMTITPKTGDSLGETSFQAALSKRKENEHTELKELDEFELLEDLADNNASFLSDLSTVNKVLGHHNALKEDKNNEAIENVDSDGSTTDCGDDLTDSESETDESMQLEARTMTRKLATCISEAPQVATENDETVVGDEDSNQDAEEENVSDDDVNFGQGHQPKKSQEKDPNEFDDEEAWGDVSSATPKTHNNTNKPKVLEDYKSSPPPTSNLVNKLFPTTKPKPTSNAALMKEHVITPPIAPVDGALNQLLMEKKKELEREVVRFREENASLAALHKERADGLAHLKKEMALFEEEKNAELERIQKFKAEEMKKIKKEKKVFELYQKSRSAPDKKDKQEIERLKNELGELKEELSRKEKRWTSANSRLRGKVETLEKENKELKDEVKVLERERLAAIERGEKAINSARKDAGDTASLQSEPSHPRAVDVRPNPEQENPVASFHTSQDLPPAQPLSPRKSFKPKSSPREKATPRENLVRKRAMTLSITNAVDTGDGVYSEVKHPDGKLEKLFTNGAREILFVNGTRKQISADGHNVVVRFFNGDIKQIFADERVVYFYSETNTTHTTYPDGLEIMHFPSGQIEKHYPDGTREITFPDQTIKYLFPSGAEESIFTDGTVIRVEEEGSKKTMEFPNGQREIHTDQFKRREYPDGTVKTVYPDGRQETRYSSGRMRIKDSAGNILVDQRM